MNANEQAYLKKYREADTLRDDINEMIADLHGICASLKTWQKTSAELASGTSSWNPLADISALQRSLVEYNRLTVELSRLWGNLARDERAGFAGPETLQER